MCPASTLGEFAQSGRACCAREFPCSGSQLINGGLGLKRPSIIDRELIIQIIYTCTIDELSDLWGNMIWGNMIWGNILREYSPPHWIVICIQQHSSAIEGGQFSHDTDCADQRLM